MGNGGRGGNGVGLGDTESQANPLTWARRHSRHVLKRVRSEHLQTFLARLDADETRRGLPRFVRRELYRCLECGVLSSATAAAAG